MTTTNPQDFDTLLDSILTERVGVAPASLEQRLLARLAQAAEAEPRVPHISPHEMWVSRAASGSLFTSAARMVPQRSAASTWTALALHAAVVLLIAVLVGKHVQLAAPAPKIISALFAPVPPPIAPNKTAIGGGGGHHDLAPVTHGHLPKLATEQIVPPKAPPTVAPILAAEPTLVMQREFRMADAKAPDIGAPNSTLKGFSLGNGSGTGIGAGNGGGIGPGSGGNAGGGIFHIGGGVSRPIVKYSVDPEFSEEARKAKFSGNVYVYLIINEQGLPERVRCTHDVGMGLCDKAVEAVRQYRFTPAMKDGKPVKVDMNIEVNFNIF